MDKQPNFDYVEESHADRLARKSKDAPYVPIGNHFHCQSFEKINRFQKYIPLTYNCKKKKSQLNVSGIAGCAGAVAYGIYSFKNKGAMSTSVYLMKFRVIAQSMVVVALGAGVTYSMFNDYVLPKFSKTEAKKP